MHRYISIGGIAAALCALGGCASIVSGQNQSLSVTARSDDADLIGASCALNNDKGTWYVTSPGSVTVHRSYQDLSVKCSIDDREPGYVSVKSSTKGMAFGNILFGGLIGASVDVSTGAAYDYPEAIVVTMGSKKTPAASVSVEGPILLAGAAPVATALAARK